MIKMTAISLPIFQSLFFSISFSFIILFFFSCFLSTSQFRYLSIHHLLNLSKGVTMDHFFLEMKGILLNKSLSIHIDEENKILKKNFPAEICSRIALFLPLVKSKNKHKNLKTAKAKSMAIFFVTHVFQNFYVHFCPLLKAELAMLKQILEVIFFFKYFFLSLI